MLGEKYDFDFTKISQGFDNGIFKYVEEMQIKILTKEEEAMKQAIIDYFKEHAQEYSKRLSIVLMEEEEVKKIIDLGIDAYIRANKSY